MTGLVATQTIDLDLAQHLHHRRLVALRDRQAAEEAPCSTMKYRQRSFSIGSLAVEWAEVLLVSHGHLCGFGHANQC